MLIGDAKAKDIVGGVITNALDAMFSSVGVTESQQQLFTIAFAGMALVRYDFYVWKYDSTSNGRFKNTKSIVAYTYASSVIDHAKVTQDQLLQAIYNSLGTNASPESVTEYVKKLEAAWEALEGTSPHQALTAFTKSVNERGSLRALKKAEALPELVHS